MRLAFLSILAFLSLINPFSIFAAEKFAVSHDVTYKVLESGNTKVTHNVHIKNLTTESLAKEFIIKIKSARVSNIQAFDASGSLPISQFQITGGTEARIQFGKLSPGIDKTLHWTLTYETPSLAKKVGRLWKISLPPVAKTSEADQITVSLDVPETFGNLVLAKPSLTAQKHVWTGNQATGQIVTLFGVPGATDAYQAYDFTLSYHLQNKDLVSKVLDVALPPDTAYQKVFLTRLFPKPLNVTLDPDGNWLASFQVPAKGSLAISATGSIAVFSTPKPQDSPPLGLKPYLASDVFWETASPEVQKASRGLTTSEAVYNFTVRKLSYDLTKVTKNPIRLGAAKALKTPLSAICTEFTDVFIALSRSIGVPAREIDGFAYTEDQKTFPSSLGADVLHAWPEYYDPATAGWRMVDPTWGETSQGLDYFSSFDFDHVTLAIRGLDSQKPDPAGFYKQTNKLKKYITSDPPKKDVFILPVAKDLDINASGKLTAKKKSIPTFFGLLPPKTEVKVTNRSTVSSKIQSLTLDAKILHIPMLPPGGHVTITL